MVSKHGLKSPPSVANLDEIVGSNATGYGCGHRLQPQSGWKIKSQSGIVVNVAITVRDIIVVRLNLDVSNEATYSVRSRSYFSDFLCIFAPWSTGDDRRSRSTVLDDWGVLLGGGRRASASGSNIHSNSVLFDRLCTLPLVR